VRLQEYLADGLLESEAETLAVLQLDSVAPVCAALRAFTRAAGILIDLLHEPQARDLMPDVWVKVLICLSSHQILRLAFALVFSLANHTWCHQSRPQNRINTLPILTEVKRPVSLRCARVGR